MLVHPDQHLRLPVEIRDESLAFGALRQVFQEGWSDPHVFEFLTRLRVWFRHSYRFVCLPSDDRQAHDRIVFNILPNKLKHPNAVSESAAFLSQSLIVRGLRRQMKHRKQYKPAPQTHPSALAVPSYHRILVKHGLIEKTLSLPDAYKVFLKVGADPDVQKLRRKVERGNRIKHVPALYLATAMALQGMTKQELEALKLRIKEKRA
jgi:hypothetical protein